MDYPPRQVIRLLQLDMVEQALKAKAFGFVPAVNLFCSRPRGVDIASLMDTLRREALRRGQITDKKVAAFNQAFLQGVKLFGRTYEAGLLLQHNLKTMQPFKDAQYGLPMMKRGKISVLPTRIKNRDQVQKIFAKTQQLGGE